MATFERLQLPYSVDALEPYIDAQTMQLHSEKHHQAYTDKLNAAVEGTEWAEKSIEEILMNLSEIPEEKRKAVQNNGGGFFNHNHFFSILSPKDSSEPQGEIKEDIDNTFGSFQKFKEEFSNTAISQFGSGWAWLALDENGENLHIMGMPNQDNPLMHNHKPVLGIDVWEHAYYLKYQNKRAEYIEAFFNVINWEKVNEIYLAAKK